MPRIDATTPEDVQQLEERLSAPTPSVVETLGRLPGDLLILGVGGKMGPTLARMARRASEEAGRARRVIGVSRFSSNTVRQRLESWGVETLAADLLDRESLAKLPDAPLVVCMAGMKFGANDNPALTWAMNCHLPALVSERFRDSRIVAFSSGNVYGLTSVAGGGSVESDEPRPVGEYATTVMGRERMFEYFSRKLGAPMALLRLNYATELRYGVLVDLALQVLGDQPIDLSMGWVNVIWQTEANAMALVALEHVQSPPRVLNVAGPEILSVREVCERFGRLLGKTPRFHGQAGDEALLNNATASYDRLGRPEISATQMIRWTADWLSRDGQLLGKPTHFESRDGRF